MTYGAYGLVEVVGEANAILVTDRMLKTSEVEYVTQDTKCGGHALIFVGGDVAAVKAAVDAVKGDPPCEVIESAAVSYTHLDVYKRQGVALMKKINKGIGYIAGAISIGAAVAHTLVPPTPNPLAAPEYFDFDLGIMIAMGIILGIPIVLISVVIHGKIIDRIGWSAEKDENGNGLNVDEMALPEKLPSFGVSLIPIFLPVVLILLNTVIDAATGSVPAVVEFLGTKTMSMLCGVIAATIISIKFLGLKKTEESANTALQSAGLVFLITGAGGAFAAVITASGVNEAIESMVSNISGNVVIVLLLAYILGLLFRQITGSGTVASLTTFSIMQSVACLLYTSRCV